MAIDLSSVIREPPRRVVRRRRRGHAAPPCARRSPFENQAAVAGSMPAQALARDLQPGAHRRAVGREDRAARDAATSSARSRGSSTAAASGTVVSFERGLRAAIDSTRALVAARRPRADLRGDVRPRRRQRAHRRARSQRATAEAHRGQIVGARQRSLSRRLRDPSVGAAEERPRAAAGRRRDVESGVRLRGRRPLRRPARRDRRDGARPGAPRRASRSSSRRRGARSPISTSPRSPSACTAARRTAASSTRTARRLPASTPCSALGGSKEKLFELMHSGYRDLRDVPEAKLENRHAAAHLAAVAARAAVRRRRAARARERAAVPALLPGLRNHCAGRADLRGHAAVRGAAVPMVVPHRDEPRHGRARRVPRSRRRRRRCAASPRACSTTLGTTGPIVVYTPYERRVLHDLAARYRDLAARARGARRAHRRPAPA